MTPSSELLEVRTPILVVDDTPSILETLCELLQGAYDVVLATSGPEALAAALQERPFLVLLDVVMPGMDGYEVCRRLKADPATQEVPVVFITGLAEVQDVTEGFRAGAVDYVTKPFNPSELLARVKTHVDLRRRGLELRAALEQERATRRKLEEALTQVKQLSGLLPICSKCKKIRDDHGYWTQLESYLSHHTSAEFSHGICPDCAKELYPEIYEARRRRDEEK